MKTGLYLMISLVGITASASTKNIFVGSLGYPASASAHLQAIQVDLAAKAIEACGSIAKVRALNDIQIKVRTGVEAPVGRLNSAGELEFWYPNLQAKATVDCL